MHPLYTEQLPISILPDYPQSCHPVVEIARVHFEIPLESQFHQLAVPDTRIVANSLTVHQTLHEYERNIAAV